MLRTIFLFLLLFSSLQAGWNEPLNELDALIQSTEALVIKQKILRTQVAEYIGLHDACLIDMDNREVLVKTAKVAKTILDSIKEEKLTPLFAPDFISELTLFAKLYKGPSL